MVIEVRRARLNKTSIKEICKNLYWSCRKANFEIIVKYLGSLHYSNKEMDLRIKAQYGTFIDIPATSSARRREVLTELKERLCENGIFLYRDMYAFAEKLLSESPGVVRSLQQRFPAVIIDEMQDTQEFQESLLHRIFGANAVHLQRLGDPDQAIFDGMGGEDPNSTFNAKGDLRQLASSHRFGLDIGEKIVGLRSTAAGGLTSCCDPPRGDCTHTVFLYKDESCEQVLEAFGALVDRNDPDGTWRTVKAVGGVDGANGEIQKYWHRFDKNRTPSRPRLDKLIHAAHLAARTRGQTAEDYERILQAIADLLRKANFKTVNDRGQQVYYTPQSLKRWLRDEERYDRLRKLVSQWFMSPICSKEDWERDVEELEAVLGVSEFSGEAAAFLEFDQPASFSHRAADVRRFGVE
jgi:superfamily I DNA/RNA helicase